MNRSLAFLQLRSANESRLPVLAVIKKRSFAGSKAFSYVTFLEMTLRVSSYVYPASLNGMLFKKEFKS